MLITNKFDVNNIWASNYTVCAKQGIDPLEVGEAHMYTCEERNYGRYVVIMKSPATFEIMQICEVEVYTNNALSKLISPYLFYNISVRFML